MLFRIASILVACTASEAIASERSLKRKLATKTPKFIQNFLDFADDKVPLKMNGPELVDTLKKLKLGGIKVGDYLPKTLAVLGAVGIVGELVGFYIYFFLYKLSASTGGEWILSYINAPCFYMNWISLVLMDAVGIWKIESKRVTYGIVLATVTAATILYGMDGYAWIDKGALNRINQASWWPTLVSYKIFFLVSSFNYLKVLLPVLLKFMDSVKSKVN